MDAFSTLLLSMLLTTAAAVMMLTQPEQVHIAYGDLPTQMTFMWVTINKTEPSVVEYGQTAQFVSPTTGPPAVKFTDGGNEKRTMYMHTVTVNRLTPGKRYMYHVGSPETGWSDLFSFRAMPVDAKWSPTFAVFGDMGNVNAKSLPYLQQAAQRGGIDAVLHVGDFAYDMHDDNARVGDAFMRQIEPVASYIPYMVCPGNHEAAYNFSNYKSRFSMPGGSGDNMLWSVNIGPVHVIAVNTEVYYAAENGTRLGAQLQYEWLERDLQKANQNRKQWPWIIIIGHRPMYCSTNDGIGQHCNNVDANPIRVGIPKLGMLGFEDLFYKYAVDLQFYAHEHSYERLWPVYNKKVCNGTASDNVYDNPPAPVHIVTGSGGNSEGQTKFDPIPFAWSAFRSDDYGYSRLKVVNTTHLQIDQVSVDHKGKVIDSMTLIRNKHEPGMYNCQ